MSILTKDLEVGEIYYSEYSKEGDWPIKGTGVIIKVKTKGTTRGDGIALKTETFYGNNSWDVGYNTRLATPEEKFWLNTCIQANDYVKKPNYEIPTTEYEKSLIDELQAIINNSKQISNL